MRRFARALAVLVAAVTSHAVAAAPAYPRHPVTLVVADAEKSPIDLIARQFAKDLGAIGKQPVQVRNVAGANGLEAAQRVARARADGYTLLFASNALFTVAARMTPLAGLDARKDLAPVAGIGAAPWFLGVPREMSVNAPRELIGNAKLRHVAVRYSVTGNDALGRLAVASLAQRAGFGVEFVSGSEGASAEGSLAEGRAQLLASPYTVIQPLTDRGRSKIVGVTTVQRFPALPDVASVGEAVDGWPDYSLLLALYAPARTPTAVIEAVREAAGIATQRHFMLKALFSRGFMPMPLTAAQLGERLTAKARKRETLAEAAGLKRD